MEEAVEYNAGNKPAEERILITHLHGGKPTKALNLSMEEATEKLTMAAYVELYGPEAANDTDSLAYKFLKRGVRAALKGLLGCQC